MIVVTGVARIIRRVNGPASMIQLLSGSRALRGPVNFTGRFFVGFVFLFNIRFRI